MVAEFEQEDLPEEVLKKLTKAQLISYIQGDIDVKVEEDGSFTIIEINDNDE